MKKVIHTWNGLMLVILLAGTCTCNLPAQDTINETKALWDTSYFVPDDDDYNLVMAAEKGDSLSVLLLLKRGADVNGTTWDEVTPLMYASEQGHLGIVQLFILHGALVNVKPDNGFSALLIAAIYDHIDIVELLILSGADINDADNEAATSLMYAAAYNYYILADMLIFYGADTEQRDEEGNTALIMATHAGNAELVDVLLVNQAEVNVKNNQGNTPLHIASEHGYEDIVQTLIEFGADLDAENDFGITPIAIAAMNGHQEVVKKLLYYDADPDYSRKPSENPLYLAKKNKHNEVVQVLKEGGADPISFKPEITRLLINFTMDWNSTDFMYGGSIGTMEDNTHIGLSLGYLTRAGHKRVLIEKGPRGYYQLFEKRSLAYLELKKRFIIGSLPRNGKWGLLVGPKVLYTYGKYRGFVPNPDGKILVAPKIGYYSMRKHTSFSLCYEYLNFDVYKVSPHRITISLSGIIHFIKRSNEKFKVNWLD